ncbi:EthD family reductase [Mycobacterium sp. NPDC003449]
MTKMIVVCAGDSHTRFDREYYVNQHFPLAMECWGKYGLQAVDAFFPAGEGDGWVSIGVYRFLEAANVDAALAAPETERVMADVKNFTDTSTVLRSIFSPL